jgi:hypothetical protein
MVFGPAVAVRAVDYDRIGGHAGVRGEVAEDLALARAATRAGLPVRSVLGGGLLGYRMYPEGLGRLIEGWSKNLAVGAGSTPPLRLGATVLWVTAVLQAGVLVVVSPGVLSGLLAAAVALQVAVLLRRLGRFGPLTVLLFPLLLAVFVLLFARSILLTALRRAVPWRGRTVPVRP